MDEALLMFLNTNREQITPARHVIKNIKIKLIKFPLNYLVCLIFLILRVVANHLLLRNLSEF